LHQYLTQHPKREKAADESH